MTQDIFTQQVHPIILQMAQERPLHPGFETRADLVRWLGERVRTARTIFARYAADGYQPGLTSHQARQMLNAKSNLEYFEGELIAHRAILAYYRE